MDKLAGTRLVMMMALLILAGCNSAGLSASQLPPGDAVRGKLAFAQPINGAPTCSSCHSLDGSTMVGPTLQGYSALAASRIENMSATDYTYQSIVQPAAHLVTGFSNLMYTQYAGSLTPVQISDLIAYLLTL